MPVPVSSSQSSAESCQSHRPLAAALALVALAQTARSGWLLRPLHTVNNYDGAWYYLVARNLATGRGLTDSMLWCYLAPPDHVVRPAGDYWSIGWSLLLAAGMRVLGTEQRATLVMCAVLSVAVSVLAAAVCWILCRDGVAAACTGFLLVVSQPIDIWRINPDSMMAYIAVALLGLGAFLLARSDKSWLLAGLLVGLPFWFRGEGFILPLTCVVVLLVQRQFRYAALLIMGVSACVLPLLFYNLAAFGHLSPPARGLTLWMRSYQDLFRLSSHPSFDAWWADGWNSNLSRMGTALKWHFGKLLISSPWPLFVLAGIGLWRLPRGRVVAWFALLSVILPAVLAPAVSNLERAVSVGVLGCAILAGGALGSMASRRAWVPVGLVAAAFLYWPLASPYHTSEYLTAWQAPPTYLADPRIASLGLGQNDLILCDQPWQVTAFLDVPSVLCPIDGVRPVFRYRPTWIIVQPDSLLADFRDANFAGIPVELRLKTGDAEWYHVSPMNSGMVPRSLGFTSR